jgi:hypothetical protein
VATILASPLVLGRLLRARDECQRLLPRLHVLRDTSLVHVRLQRPVRRLAGLRARRRRADARAALLHHALAAARQLVHGIPDHPYPLLHAVLGTLGLSSILRGGRLDQLLQVLRVHAIQVPRPPRHAQPRVGISRLVRLDSRPLLVLGPRALPRGHHGVHGLLGPLRGQGRARAAV